MERADFVYPFMCQQIFFPRRDSFIWGVQQWEARGVGIGKGNGREIGCQPTPGLILFPCFLVPWLWLRRMGCKGTLGREGYCAEKQEASPTSAQLGSSNQCEHPSRIVTVRRLLSSSLFWKWSHQHQSFNPWSGILQESGLYANQKATW